MASEQKLDRVLKDIEANDGEIAKEHFEDLKSYFEAREVMDLVRKITNRTETRVEEEDWERFQTIVEEKEREHKLGIKGRDAFQKGWVKLVAGATLAYVILATWVFTTVYIIYRIHYHECGRFGIQNKYYKHDPSEEMPDICDVFHGRQLAFVHNVSNCFIVASFDLVCYIFYCVALG